MTLNKLKSDLNAVNLECSRLKDAISDYHREQKSIYRDNIKLSRIAFHKEHKKMLIALDVAVVLVILMNFGALLMTNALVVKENPTWEFYEVNSVVAERNDYVQHPEVDSNKLLDELMFYSLAWSILLTIYIFARSRVRNLFGLYMLIVGVLFYILSFGTDFINDVGFYTGKLFWSVN